MAYCKNCGVELEDNVSCCPLCGEAVNGEGPVQKDAAEGAVDEETTLPAYGIRQMSGRRKKRFTWEVTSIVLFPAVLATLIINLSISKAVTWSAYPLAVCLTAFSYVSFFAFARPGILIRLGGGFIASSAFLWILDLLTEGRSWAFELGIPVLLCANLIILALLGVSRLSRYKGLDLIAASLIGVALLCMCLDGILSFYINGWFHMGWSLLVAASILPVAVALFFVHFRLKKGRNFKRDFKKTFHI